METKQVTKELFKFIKAKAKEYKTDLEDVPAWVIVACAEYIKSKEPTKEQKRIDKASELLTGDSDIKEQIKLIEACEDENEIIDYIEGVTVWEKVEFSFTAKQFLEYIS